MLIRGLQALVNDGTGQLRLHEVLATQPSNDPLGNGWFLRTAGRCTLREPLPDGLGGRTPTAGSSWSAWSRRPPRSRSYAMSGRSWVPLDCNEAGEAVGAYIDYAAGSPGTPGDPATTARSWAAGGLTLDDRLAVWLPTPGQSSTSAWVTVERDGRTVGKGVHGAVERRGSPRSRV